MALSRAISNPTKAEPYQAYIRIIDFRLNMTDRTGRIVLGAWESKANHTANLAPLDQITIAITRDGEPEVVEVKDSNDVVITPGRAAVPSFADLRAAYPSLFTTIQAAIEGFVAAHPDFAGGSQIPD
jgi:hypothetical protein